ncbi:MAG: LysR family transcriptional regulator [Vitreoscilla sp.]
MKHLNLRTLRIFETVVSCGSFSRAAEQLEMTQPAVSMQIRQLETELGTALFDPKHRQRMTDAGRELLQHARLIGAQVRAAEAALLAHQGESAAGVTRGLRGLLHLGVVSTAHYFAPRLLHAFNQIHPEVRLKLTVAKRPAVLRMLQDHQLDIAISGYPPSEGDLEATTFARNPHCIVAHPDSPLANRSRLRWADLRDEHFIFREEGSATRQFLEQLLQSQSIQVKAGMELAGNETIKQAVMCGMGISFLSAHTFQVELLAGLIAVLDVVDMPKYVDWCFVQRRDTVLSGVNAAFREFVIANGADWASCRRA